MSLLKINARQILDSRGNPTVEVDVITYKGLYFTPFSIYIAKLFYGI